MKALSIGPLIVFSVLQLASFLRALEPIAPAGERVLAVIEAMDVERLWLSGAIVDWRTGLPTGKPITDSGNHTHCSQFAAAACERLGVYILRPPEHSAVLLANAQHEWLGSEAGRAMGWGAVGSAIEAQDRANKGELVVAVYKNLDEKKSGHIAIIRPGFKTPEEIAVDGPEVIQAGGTNYTKTSLRQGFKNHPKGYDKIRFFAHPSPATRSVS
jgi:hypothetical protein